MRIDKVSAEVKLAEVTVTKAMSVRETLETAMPDSVTRQVQGKTHLGNNSSRVYLGKSRMPSRVCSKIVLNKSKTDTTMVIQKW